MSNYTPVNNWTPKDGAADPILAAEHDSEYSAIQTAIATKEDAANRDIANGYCPLNPSKKVPPANLNFGTAASTVAEGDHNHNPATSASKWFTGRTLTLSGDASGTSSTWDGSGNATLTVVVANNSHTHNGSTISGLDGADITTGTVADARLPSSISSDTTGNAATATLATTATNANNINVGSSPATVVYPLFVNGTGNQDVDRDTGTNFNSSTNKWTATDFVATSDIALKENIEPFTGALDALSKIGTYLYDRKDSGEHHTGVLAQEVRDAVPTAVDGDEGKLAVSTQQLLSVVIGAVNELREKLDGITS